MAIAWKSLVPVHFWVIQWEPWEPWVSLFFHKKWGTKEINKCLSQAHDRAGAARGGSEIHCVVRGAIDYKNMAV